MSTTALTSPAALPPVPRLPGWSVGHLLRMRSDPISLLMDGVRMGSDVVTLTFGATPAFLLYAPDSFHRALMPTDGLWKGTRGSRLLRRILGPGLLTTEGVAWRGRRRRAQPRFRHEALRALPGAVQRHADRMVAGWADGDEPDVMAACSRLALTVVCDALFGLDPGEDGDRVHRALDEVLASFLWIMTFPVEGVEKWPLPASRRHRAAVRELDAVVGRFIERRRALGGLESDLLGDWIRAADAGEMSEADLRAEVVTMLLAGHETTANTMAFTLALLATHPEEQAKVLAGLGAGDPGPLERAIDEALRLYPPAWMVARATTDPLDLGPATAPPGAFLFVPIAAIHRDPRWWSRPDEFVPDRHLALSPQARAAFLPFGVGARKCIGEHFARTEARVVLATVLRAFGVEADAVPEAKASVTLRPADEVRVRLRGR